MKNNELECWKMLLKNQTDQIEKYFVKNLLSSGGLIVLGLKQVGLLKHILYIDYANKCKFSTDLINLLCSVNKVSISTNYLLLFTTIVHYIVLSFLSQQLMEPKQMILKKEQVTQFSIWLHNVCVVILATQLTQTYIFTQESPYYGKSIFCAVIIFY